MSHLLNATNGYPIVIHAMMDHIKVGISEPTLHLF